MQLDEEEYKIDDDWQSKQKQHHSEQKVAVETLEHPEQQSDKFQVMRWNGDFMSCSMDKKTREISSEEFATVAVPRCIVTRMASADGVAPGKAYYEVEIRRIGGKGMPVLGVGWATFALPQHRFTGSSSESLHPSESVGSWSVDGLQKVQCPVVPHIELLQAQLIMSSFVQRKFEDGDVSSCSCDVTWKEGDVVGVAIDLIEQSMSIFYEGKLIEKLRELPVEGTSEGVFPAVSVRGESIGTQRMIARVHAQRLQRVFGPFVSVTERYFGRLHLRAAPRRAPIQ
eukprot:1958482-Rhodomonas_salina.1